MHPELHVTTWKKAILIVGVICIVLVFVLPQVDLPQTPFNEADLVWITKIKQFSSPVSTSHILLLEHFGIGVVALRQQWAERRISSHTTPLVILSKSTVLLC
jgi:hypothetical protein